MDKKRVLVTGGTGFIGRQVVPLLLGAGHEVHVISSRAEARIDPRSELHVINLHDPESRAEVVASIGADHLLHLAWYLEPGQVWNSVENVRWAEASLGLLREFAASGGRRAVLAGTCSEYGPSEEPCNEEGTPMAPQNLYGISKDATRRVALSFADTVGLSTAWARIFFAYGPGEHPVRLVSSVIRRLLAGEEAPVSHGQQVRDYLSTPEIAAALLAVLESDFEGVVNVGSGNQVRLREMVDLIAARIGRPDLVLYGEIIPPAEDPPVLVADTTRLRESVGWEPTLTLAEGLNTAIEWWREHSDGPTQP
ncbi:MAG: NAD-dependent epimerase/dehydratase family protein [Solirubrobacterales bacterium]